MNVWHEYMVQANDDILKMRDALLAAEARIAELEKALNSRGLAVLALAESRGATIETLVDEKRAQRERIEDLEAENQRQAQTILYLTAQCRECVEKLQPEADSHVESIVCPNCNHIEQATVLHTAPFASYIHDCGQCGYTIMESEWLTVEQMIKERTEE